MRNWPLVGCRFIGPGVGDHASPDSSSRMNSASAVGSTIASLANDVRRFSRLFSLHVVAEPDAVTIVPNRGLAMTLTHGSGVSRSPSSTIAYVWPPSVNPPTPFESVRADAAARAPGARRGGGGRGGAGGGRGAGGGGGGGGRGGGGARGGGGRGAR